MSKSLINKARNNKHQSMADKYYDAFNEKLEHVYGVRRHGYMWENKKILDVNDPNYKEESTPEIDQTIIQAFIEDSIPIIGAAALEIMKTKNSNKGRLYTKTAIVFFEAIHAYEHLCMIAKYAHRKYSDEFFRMKAENYNNMKNKNHTVIFDIDVLCDELNNLQN